MKHPKSQPHPQSIWQNTVTPPTFAPLSGDTKTDVLIVGGGLAGLLTAYQLEKRGVNYLLVEQGRICGRTSGNTTAKITVQHGLIYHKIIRRYGIGTAKAYYLANRAAANEYALLCREIDCDYETADNFVYTTDERDKLEMEMQALETIDCPANFYSELPFPFSVAGAVSIPNQAQFHPLKFAFSLSKNLNIAENTAVKNIDGNIIYTDRGIINAKQIVITTHFPFLDRWGGYFLKLYQHRSYVLALENASSPDGMYVDDALTGLSFRHYKNMLLLSGGGHRTGKKGGNWQELRDFAKKYYPNSKEVCFWSAQDCMPLDDMPYIGRYSKQTPNLFVATGFQKWGMTGTMLAATMLADMLTKQKNDFIEIFRPNRSIFSTQLLINSGESVLNLLTPTVPRCPHLGCALKWNSAEHSWDCPCHGSRFARNGKVLNGPANGDI